MSGSGIKEMIEATQILEPRDPEFAEKMAEVLCVYRKVRLLRNRNAGEVGGY